MTNPCIFKKLLYVVSEMLLVSVKLDPNTAAVIPPNLVPGKFVFYTTVNIDILYETLDGMDTFHATQVAAWQRGPAADIKLDTMDQSTERRLGVQEVTERLSLANMPAVGPTPIFHKPVDKPCYDQSAGSVQDKQKQLIWHSEVHTLQRVNDTN